MAGMLHNQRAMDQNLRPELQTNQRMALLGRLRMAEWIEMREPEFAGEIEKLEKDPLFKKLHFGSEAAPGVIRRQRWPRTSFSNSFYDVGDQPLAGSQRVGVEELLGDRKDLLPKIRKMGQDAFESYFLYADEPLTLAEIAKRTKLTLAEVEEIHDLLLEIGAQAEFAGPGSPTPGEGYTCLAKVSLEDGEEPAFQFLSPHWARGLYHIRYDLLEDWKEKGGLESTELKRLPHLLRRLETINLRQNTLFRIMESLTKLQSGFLNSKRTDLKRPMSLRQLARRLDLAPSTVSRAAAGRSVRLPWGKEIPLIEFLPGRRRVMREVLGRWIGEDPRQSDSTLAARLRDEYGIKISRRTVNAVRHELPKLKL
jgi:hypothetical protein